jgi:hypothetical protein
MNKILVSLLIVAIAVGITLPAMAATEAENSANTVQKAMADSDAASGAASGTNKLANTATGDSDASSGANTGTVNIDVFGTNVNTATVDQTLNNKGDLSNTGLQAIMAGSAEADSDATNGNADVKAKANGGDQEIKDSGRNNEVEASGNAAAGVGPVTNGATSGAVAMGGDANGNDQNQLQINAVVQIASADVTTTQDLHQMVLAPFSQKNGAKSYVDIEDNGEGAYQDASPASGDALSSADAADLASTDENAMAHTDLTKIITETETEINTGDIEVEL